MATVSSKPAADPFSAGDLLYVVQPGGGRAGTLGALATYLSGAGGAGGTVTSVGGSGGDTGLSFTGGPVTGAGTLTLAGTLVPANGGTGVASLGALKTAMSFVKGDVGLGSVDNTADTAKPVSTAQQTALNLKANLAGPTFTGTPTLPTGSIATTQTAGNNTTAIATTAFVATALNLKANLASPTFTGTVTVPTPSNATDAASKGYVDALKQALDIKDSVRVASTANVTIASALINGSTMDGVTLATGDRVLLKDQSTASQNGIYLVVASGAATRTIDADVSAEVTTGMYVFVSAGAVNGATGFVLTTADPITLATTSLTFTQFSGAGQITSGAGLTKSGNTLDVVGTANRIVVAADSIDIGTDVVTLTGAQTLTDKRLTPRVSSSASPTSPLAPNSDTIDQYSITGLTTALTINADAGSPTAGQKIVYRIKDNGTARALTWITGSSKSFRAIGVVLPTTTVVNKTMYVGSIYNNTDARWDVVAVTVEA